MKKIASVWVRDFGVKGAPYRNEVTPGCEWVLAGEGVATRKYDGTAVLVDATGALFARYDAKRGKAPPAGFIHCQEPDPETGHWPGWVPATRPEDKWIRDAFESTRAQGLVESGTWEAIGPKIGGNPEACAIHVLVRHGADVLEPCPRDFDGLRAWLAPLDIEGVVFHHLDGRMAKATKQGFGLPRRREVAP